MSQCQLARRAGLDRHRIQRWLSGRRSLRVSDLVPVLAALGIELVGPGDPAARRVRVEAVRPDPSNGAVQWHTRH